jgi:hypothetical protein
MDVFRAQPQEGSGEGSTAEASTTITNPYEKEVGAE